MTTFEIKVHEEQLGSFRDVARGMGWTVTKSQPPSSDAPAWVRPQWLLTVEAEDVPEEIEGRTVDPVFVHSWRDDSYRVQSWGVTDE